MLGLFLLQNPNPNLDKRGALYIGAFCDLDTMRANGEYRCFLHIWSVGDDTNSRADKKHHRRKPFKSQCGTYLIASDT
jgi:hypothetical protein